MGKKLKDETPLPERILQEEKKAPRVNTAIGALRPEGCVICGALKEKFSPGSGKELNEKWICPDCVSQI